MNLPPPLRLALLSSALLLGGALVASAESEDDTTLARWLSTNSSVSTLRVEFTQTRRLASLKNPIRRKGVVWLDHRSKRLRWQIGDPPKTIVTKHGSNLLIVRPRAKKFERRASDAGGNLGWSVLARGFPRTVPEFRKSYRLLGIKPRKETLRILTQPLDRSARGVQTFTFVLGSTDHRLRGMELTFRDGSSQHVLFTKTDVNPRLPTGLFQPDLTGYQATKF